MKCEQCGESPCVCDEIRAAHIALYGHEECPRCGRILDDLDRCPSCDRWDDAPDQDDEEECF